MGVLGGADLRDPGSVRLVESLEALRYAPLGEVADRAGGADHPRIEQRRQKRNADRDLEHLAAAPLRQRRVDDRDHEGELSYLREREPGLNGSLDLNARKKRHDGNVEALADDHDERHYENRAGICP